MIRLRPAVLVVAAWMLGAATSVGVGLLALTLVGEDFDGNASQPLTADAAAVVDPGSSSDPTPTAGSSQPAVAATTRTSDGQRLHSVAGDVVARCSGLDAYLVYWSPAQGFRVDDVVRGPARAATVTFESSTTEVKLRITCVGGLPRLQVSDERRDDD